MSSTLSTGKWQLLPLPHCILRLSVSSSIVASSKTTSGRSGQSVPGATKESDDLEEATIEDLTERRRMTVRVSAYWSVYARH